MNSQTHFLFPFFLCLVLYKLQFVSLKLAVIAGFVGVLIDLDHYIEHIKHAKKNKFSIKDTWNNSEHFHKFPQRSSIHHETGATIITLLLILTALMDYKIALVLAIAYYSHLYLDYLWIEKPHYMRMKFGKLYFRETHFEFVLDIILILAIIIIFIMP